MKGTIAPEIYGHFTEHIGGVIYDGIWVGKNSKIPNIKGFRKEIIEKLRAINAPVIRWPGGSYADAYDWLVAWPCAFRLYVLAEDEF